MARPGDKPPHFIRQWRKYRQLTLEQLAERIDMTHQNLGKIERFLVPYTQPVIERLAVALRTDPASLIMRDPLESEALWSIWEQLGAPERRKAAKLLSSLQDDEPVAPPVVVPLKKRQRRR